MYHGAGIKEGGVWALEVLGMNLISAPYRKCDLDKSLPPPTYLFIYEQLVIRNLPL